MTDLELATYIVNALNNGSCIWEVYYNETNNQYLARNTKERNTRSLKYPIFLLRRWIDKPTDAMEYLNSSSYTLTTARLTARHFLEHGGP